MVLFTYFICLFIHFSLHCLQTYLLIHRTSWAILLFTNAPASFMNNFQKETLTWINIRIDFYVFINDFEMFFSY